MGFPDSFVEEVRRVADIVRLVSDQVALKKVGASWKGLCPFHREKTPSFHVRSEPPLFHCFGCGEGGDVFKFIMLHERVGFPEAIEIVAKRFGVPVPERRGFEPGRDRQEREGILELMEAAAQYFERNLWTAAGERAREYLLGRGFKRETLERIRAGAARDSWSDLLEALTRGFSREALLRAGLVVAKEDSNHFYDRFRNRVVFPILNESGKVVAFGARSLDGSEPKYVNSPETSVYQKSRILYGLSWAKDTIRKEGRVVLMEGYLDVARALEAGVGEAVATCGTALTAGHARLLRRFAERVIVNFDQDEAGQKATRKSFETLVDEDIRVRVVELPPGHDPDTYLKAFGVEAYRERVEKAPEYVEWLIRRAATENDIGTPGGKAAYLNALLPTLALIKNAVERAAWLPAVAAAGGLDERATEQELQRALATRAPVSAESQAVRPPRSELLAAERWLVALMVSGVEGADEAVCELTEEELHGLSSAEILRAAKALLLRGERVTVAALAAEIPGEGARRTLNEIAVEDVPLQAVTPGSCVKELRCVPLKARMAEIQRDLAAATGPTLEALLQEKLHLRRQMANL